MATRMETRTKEVALILCFLVLAGGLAAISEGLVPPVFGVSVIGLSSGGVVSAQSAGTLLVVVTNSTLTLPSAVFGIRSFPVANASFTVLSSDVAPASHGVFETNATGEKVMRIAPGSYSLSFTNLPVNVSEVIKINSGERTSVQVSLTSSTYYEAFLDMPTNESGMVPAWSHAAVAIPSPVNLVGSSEAYLDLYYNTGQLAQLAVKTPLTVTNSTLRTVGTTEVEWIAFQPDDSIAIHQLVTVEFSIYGAQMSVSTGGGPNLGS